MFVYSIKKRQIKLAVLITFLLILAIVLIALSKSSIEANKTAALNIRASTGEERIAYLSQFGWSVKEDPVEVCEVIIPSEFDDTYSAYNEIQKQQDFDLTPYASKRVKRWTYEVTNYSGYENTSFIHANILVYDGMVIGGDICSTELNGFMQGFAAPDTYDELSTQS